MRVSTNSCAEPEKVSLGSIVYFGGQVFVFEISGANKFKHRIAEKKRSWVNRSD
jgi:hypothetical protein